MFNAAVRLLEKRRMISSPMIYSHSEFLTWVGKAVSIIRLVSAAPRDVDNVDLQIRRSPAT
jgi:hypothetical protein